MKIIKHLSDQLKAYSITAITVAASSSTINATVINNNLNANIQDSSFDLDLNNDGVNDFTIQASLISSDWSKTSDPSSAGGPGGQSNWTWKWVGGSANMSLNATATPDGYNALMTTGGFSTVSAVPQGGTIGPEKNFVSEALNIGGLWWGEWQERKYDMVNNST
ncbi:MAG: hypothetical protein HRT72_13320, partial [Flavobacteriales bacterium]|nr:hypothetical protein [Flavobacteriales bacterium]